MTRPTLASGTDVVAVERIRELVERFGDSFLERVYTPEELAYCRSRAAPAQHLAARWAGKEATTKALDADLVHGDVAVLRDGGAPRVELPDSAAVDGEVAVSLSHDRTLGVATAQVVVRPAAGATGDAAEDRP